MILDAYQSAGIVPLDVTALDVDFAVGGSVKWLCGGPGNGWLYVRPDLAERLEPTYTGWQAHERPFAFEEEMRLRGRRGALPHRHAERPGALRGDPGYDLIEEIGVERIRENSLRQTELLIDLADEAGFGIAARASRRAAAGRSPCTSPSSRRCTRSWRSADPLRLPPRRRHPARPALLHLGRRAPARIAQIAEIVETGAYERHRRNVARH